MENKLATLQAIRIECTCCRMTKDRSDYWSRGCACVNGHVNCTQIIFGICEHNRWGE